VCGVIRYHPPLRVFAVIVLALGVAGAAIQDIPEIAAAGAGLALLMLLYGWSSVRTIEVGDEVIIDGTPLSEYAWVRGYLDSSELRSRLPAAVVAYRRPGRHPFARLRGRLRPSHSPRRAVVFFNWWRDDEGRLVTSGAVYGLLRTGAGERWHRR
jgi:hypothetical protein